MMKYLIIMLLFASQIATAEIYKWTDESGRVHFGDSPSDETAAEQVNVEVNSYENVTYENIEFYKGANSKRVIMYSTSWCGYCKKARSYFKKNDINYVEYDIEKNKRAKQEYDSLGGTVIPVILVGKKKMNGFNIADFKDIYK